MWWLAPIITRASHAPAGIAARTTAAEPCIATPAHPATITGESLRPKIAKHRCIIPYVYRPPTRDAPRYPHTRCLYMCRASQGGLRVMETYLWNKVHLLRRMRDP
jgi:hypothetical protein